MLSGLAFCTQTLLTQDSNLHFLRRLPPWRSQVRCCWGCAAFHLFCSRPTIVSLLEYIRFLTDTRRVPYWKAYRSLLVNCIISAHTKKILFLWRWTHLWVFARDFYFPNPNEWVDRVCILGFFLEQSGFGVENVPNLSSELCQCRYFSLGNIRLQISFLE